MEDFDNENEEIANIEEPIVPTASYNRNWVDSRLDMFRVKCLINGQQIEAMIDNGSHTHLVAQQVALECHLHMEIMA